MKSVTSWLERKLFLKVSATKTKVVRPTKGQFLGFTFYKAKTVWKCTPTKDRKKRLYSNIQKYLERKHAVSRPLSVTFKKLNQMIRGWIQYFKISSIKVFLEEFGQWLRHKVDVLSLNNGKDQGLYTRIL